MWPFTNIKKARKLKRRLSRMSSGYMPNGWKLNPDKAVVERIVSALERNMGFCPCVPTKRYEDMCRCLDFREGRGCHCNLYVED